MAGNENNYHIILSSLKEKIKLARQNAALAVNKELLLIYWEIGNTISLQQKSEGWGTKVIDRLAADLKTEFPDFKGLSVRNLKYMKAFAEAYPDFIIVQPVVAQLQEHQNQQSIFVQPLVAQIPWAHHIVLLNKVPSKQLREFYIKKTAENGWSKSVLAAQIESQLHMRQGNAITNFAHTLPAAQSDLARETLKNPYLFDFLSIGEEMQERELEKALIQHIKKFMLELGRGFAYVGNQYNLNVEGDDFFLDLLFYNYHMHCFVVFELKVGEFKPEFAGKLNFYINTINDQIKGKEDKPTIGVLLCKTPNETVVKYSLQGIDTPMGVAAYEFTNALPKQLKGEMPTIEELEQEIENELAILKKPIDEKKSRLWKMLQQVKGKEVKKERDREALDYIFNEVLWGIKEKTERLLHEEILLFKDARIDRSINGSTYYNATNADLEAKLLKENVHQLGLNINLDGFKKAGTKTFGVYVTLTINLNKYMYTVSENREPNWFEKLYHEKWEEDELQQVAEKWCELILDEMSKRINQVIDG